MEIYSAKYLISNENVDACPKPDKPEYAFIGRSNVGKSSLINMLTNQSRLAKISSSPGKTQLINHFIVNNEWFLVDLPGYGYAKVSQQRRAKWASLTSKAAPS
jgi:GTP-binding protein